MQALGIAELNGRIEPHFWKMWNTPTYVFENSIGSIKTHFKDAVYHMLDNPLKFSPTENAMCT